jgi:hypothetical protein
MARFHGAFHARSSQGLPGLYVPTTALPCGIGWCRRALHVVIHARVVCH